MEQIENLLTRDEYPGLHEEKSEEYYNRLLEHLDEIYDD